jgi:hypothetical protein
VELIRPGHTNISGAGEKTDWPRRRMEPKCKIRWRKTSAPKTVLDYGLGAQADLFGGQGVCNQGFGPFVLKFDHCLGESEEPSDVRVVPACVHDVNFCAIREPLHFRRRPRQACRLANRVGVYIRAKPRHRPRAAPEQADYARLSDSFPHFKAKIV